MGEINSLRGRKRDAKKLKFLIMAFLLPYFDVFNYFAIKNIYAKFVYVKIMYEICNIIMLLHCSNN